MVDFLTISSRSNKNGTEIYPTFRTYPKSQDLMIRGGDFYAIWNEDLGVWSTDEDDAKRIIDQELIKYYEENKNKLFNPVVRYMWDSDSGSIDRWHKFCQKQLRDSYENLDEKLVFANSETNKKDYASKRLDYPLEAGDISAWDKLISTLYSKEEREKIEWAIGCVVSGESKFVQKFMVLYGEGGTGKSTILNVIQKLFKGYDCVFDAKSLGSSTNQFALETFKNNPLVGIQHDGDLSRIEDNTTINSLVSHEQLPVNTKYGKIYTTCFKAFLFMGTNKPVKITDAKSGIIRRLIDVHPTGMKLGRKEYYDTIKKVDFELGAIAHHCLGVYLNDPGKYDSYIPTSMLGASNDFYNFVIDAYHVFKKEDGTTLKAAWEMYKQYCEDAKVPYPYSQRNFKEELKNYFWNYDDRFNLEDGSRVRSYYSKFRTDIFGSGLETKKETYKPNLIQFEERESELDIACADYLAQYATANETPTSKWEKVKTKLSKLDTSRLHYVKVPENHIVIDFDLKDENGNKSLEKNIEEASKWPPTYAELSKSGGGVHLHYIYNGDVSKLSRVYDDNIEVKVFTGKSSLRRKLTKCNNLPIATISSGLPLKGEDKLVSFDAIKSEKGLRTMIKRNLNKEIHPATKPSIDFIFKILEDAYNGGLNYDVSDMENAVIAFAASSTNQADYCIKLVNKMKFKSEEPSAPVTNDEAPLIFYDVEVFPNLFLVNWKVAGEGKPVVRMINPKPHEIEELLKYRLVGFNNRRYDNHMLWARLMGYSEEQLYNLSQKIIKSKKGEGNKYLFSEAFNISYTDIYDFASAGNKKSLKKLEIEMGIHHQELGLPWDQPVPKEKWIQVAEYCDNDVIATEAAFHYLSADWTARLILADLAEMTPNDTTNTLTTKIIFGNNRKPQSEFNYRDMSQPVYELDPETLAFLKEACPEMMAEPHGEAKSLLPYFPGYKYERGVSTYRDVNESNPNPENRVIGEGGYVYAEPGMYGNVALLDIASMHPHSAIAEVIFGARFTRRFKEIVDGRVSIKHEAWEEVNQMLDGKLTKYIQKVIDGEMTSGELANALKTAINSVYGLTSASFSNPFRDDRNVDNIVAKRGSLFMIDLRNEVQKRGYTVVHCKTDSIKIADATPQIINFVMEFGKRYGYTFEHEATYDRICLVNKAVYIAKYKDGKHAGEWTATGKQFAVPYVFKTLFSKEQITIDDMRETFEVKSALYLDMNESLPDVTGYENEIEKLETKYKKGQLSDITFENECARLNELIWGGHDYRFVGKVGEFCPIKEGKGGGILCREQDGKYYAATGTTGYRWLESELVLAEGNEENIDKSYYRKLVDDAADAISKFGSFDWFVSDEPYVKKEPVPDFMHIPEVDDEEIPF